MKVDPAAESVAGSFICNDCLRDSRFGTRTTDSGRKAVSGWRVANLTITNNRDDDVGGAGIVVYSSSNNGSIENITFPSSSTLATGVRIHWAGYTPAGSLGPTASGHPHNIGVRNISCGEMTKPANTGPRWKVFG